MSVNWLHAYLLDAVAQNVCTRIGCGTCGALKFRRGVLTALAGTTGNPGTSLDPAHAVAVAQALADVTPELRDRLALEPAVRCLLFDLWSVLQTRDGELESLLDGTWAGNVLSKMKEHHRTRVAARHAHEERQAVAAQQREEKKRLKLERHRERLAAKRERDRLWRRRHAPAD